MGWGAAVGVGAMPHLPSFLGSSAFQDTPFLWMLLVPLSGVLVASMLRSTGAPPLFLFHFFFPLLLLFPSLRQIPALQSLPLSPTSQHSLLAPLVDPYPSGTSQPALFFLSTPWTVSWDKTLVS